MEKPMSVHMPTDIGLFGLKTRILLRKRSGRPRSEINNTGEITEPAAAIQRASFTTSRSATV